MDFLKENPEHLNSFLGFKVPKDNYELYLDLIERNPSVKEDLENHAFYKQEEFENVDYKNILKHHKTHHNDKKIKLDKNTKTLYIDAVNISELGPVEKAFFLGFDPDRKVLSDIEANKIKMMSPSVLSKPASGIKDELPKMEIEPIPGLDLDRGNDIIEEQKEPTICLCAVKEVTLTDVDLCICCETCNKWYHHLCFGLGNTTEEDLKKMTWNCPDCELKPKNSEKKQPKKQRRGVK